MHNKLENTAEITLFLCGDVMTGRGVDQILPHPSDPILYESYVKNAKDYASLAENVHGKIERNVSYTYVWGEALNNLKQRNPDIRLINLETSITTSSNYWKSKGINYRMHPENIKLISAANINACSLANNHTLDWGYEGLEETIKCLNKEKIKYSGAGKNLQEASTPIILHVKGTRVLIFGIGMTNSGIPFSWKASSNKAGLQVFTNYSELTLQEIKHRVNKYRKPGDIVILSMHWGDNWGYEISDDEKYFAHKLIDFCGVDVIHGHSSHHIKGFEMYKKKLILYGCGDFINDYEGISGFEDYRSDLCLQYFLKLNPVTGNLSALEMIPGQIKKFRINRASNEDAIWILNRINRECGPFGLHLVKNDENILLLPI